MKGERMKHLITYALLALSLSAVPGHAACFVEYKAKQDNPLRLHYGIIKVGGDCSDADAKATSRLQSNGWSLLTILSASQEKPSRNKQENAGANYLRY